MHCIRSSPCTKSSVIKIYGHEIKLWRGNFSRRRSRNQLGLTESASIDTLTLIRWRSGSANGSFEEYWRVICMYVQYIYECIRAEIYICMCMENIVLRSPILSGEYELRSWLIREKYIKNKQQSQ